MSQPYNVYCDESCHLEHDRQSIMVLGAVWCPLEKTRAIKISTFNERPRKCRPIEFAIGEVSIPQVRSLEIHTCHFHAGKVGTFELRSF